MIICFDLETTGLEPNKDKIIEIAMMKFDEKTFEIKETFSSFVNPEREIPEIISNITNIFDDDVVGAPTIDELREKITDFIGGLPFLGHNVDFDINFLKNNNIHIGENRKVDTFFLANFLNFNSDSLNLEMLCKYYDIEFSGAHRALNDVKATIKLFQKQLSTFDDLSDKNKMIINHIFHLSQDVNIIFLLNLLQLSDTNIQENDTFKDIILKKVGKNVTTKKISGQKVDNVDSLDFLQKNINLEKRKNQFKMAKTLVKALDKKEKIVIEAPTGLGKSFAYLIPSIDYAVKNNKRVYISTKTKTLQDQLYFKDLDFLYKNLDIDFTYSKLKGKRNYLSLKSYFDYIDLGNFDYAQTGLFLKISLWLLETTYGELDEINFYPFEYSTSKYLTSDFLSFNFDKNPYLDYEFLYKARKSIEKSNLVVINHSLLFSDIENDNNILGDITSLVIDEAHSIEDSLTDALKKKYSLKNLLDNFDIVEKILHIKKIKKIDFLHLKESIVGKLQIFDDVGKNYVTLKEKQEQFFKTTLIQPDFFTDIDFTNLLTKINLDFVELVDFLKLQESYDFSREIETFNYFNRILNIIFKQNNESDYIKIVNVSESYGVSFDYTLLSPSSYLQSNLWEKLDSCLLTSATLMINDTFDYIKKTLGLEDFIFSVFETDFDYKKQSTLFIPNDLGSIKNNSSQNLHFLDNFYKLVGGNVLTLLTSFSMIRSIYTNSNIGLKNMGVKLLAQSIGGSKNKLISSFLSQPDSSILLGTNSFWEGVDIPKNSIKYLVIHKFPFCVPSDPIFQARSSLFQDAFLDYSIPKAIIMLKQGFGRLIRSKNDTGVVILLDDRIINTSWGKEFYNAFPKGINIKISSSKSFLELLEKY